MVTILFHQFHLQIHGNGHDGTYKPSYSSPNVGKCTVRVADKVKKSQCPGFDSLLLLGIKVKRTLVQATEVLYRQYGPKGE